MPEVAIFDYGVGNLLSLKCALQKVGLDPEIHVSARHLGNADAIALPGVGNFSAAAGKIAVAKQRILDAVDDGIPLLGICLGMQLFFQESEEGQGKGLGLFKGKNVRLPNSVKVPHMGWNTLRILNMNEIIEDIEDGSYVYFVHSLYPVPNEKEIIITETEYGQHFASTIASQNVYGMQFHPEKSGDIGANILANFAKIVKR